MLIYLVARQTFVDTVKALSLRYSQCDWSVQSKLEWSAIAADRKQCLSPIKDGSLQDHRPFGRVVAAGESACTIICTGVMARPLSLAAELGNRLIRSTTNGTARRRRSAAIFSPRYAHLC